MDLRFFFLSLSPTFPRLGSENRLMDQAVVSTLRSHLGEEVTLDLGKGLRGRRTMVPALWEAQM